ncbi:hypothetical protein AGABI1DRAFT_119425 [Agaricus bisporus var. burnettii JB137-S8]|nr:uncharacterized protein AGABI1DRAFT_119425 [Agaricus bisporus var. burnettii JB137-S8]EKM80858.1 hypothetical protein AGABI1DRAFT_119425 [Agaricus bisporus var. burnettii JB137-S8]
MAAYATTRHAQGNKERGTDYHTTLFRRLTWEGTVPLEVRVDAKELPANSNRGLECYYVQAPRVSYLPLLLPEVHKYLMDVVFDEAAATSLKEDDWWFETEEGTLLKWHWPIGLIYDNHTISASVRAAASQRALSQALPLRLILHLVSPPTEKLMLAPSPEACKQAFMGQLKEADFIRWGNTKRITGLRKAEQDGIWESIKEHNFEEYWRIASKVTPAASSAPPIGSPGNNSMHVRPPSIDAGGVPERDNAYAVRCIPARIYLPDGPFIQELVPPLLEDGSPHTLHHFLSVHLPLLFPSRPSPPTSSRVNQPTPELAYALVQGVLTPPEAEMAWLGACLAGADGWLNVCIGLNRG